MTARRDGSPRQEPRALAEQRPHDDRPVCVLKRVLVAVLIEPRLNGVRVSMAQVQPPKVPRSAHLKADLEDVLLLT